MKNLREEQIGISNGKACINQYWEKDIVVNDIAITFHYSKRKEGSPGFNGREDIDKVVGVKGKVKRRIESVWITFLGEKYCIEQMIAKFAVTK
jgi:hypothetical protein